MSRTAPRMASENFAVVVHGGVRYPFCSQFCSARFNADPDAFVGSGVAAVVDSVCDMRFHRRDTPLHPEYNGRVYRFCSQTSFEKFVVEPERHAFPSEVR